MPDPVRFFCRIAWLPLSLLALTTCAEPGPPPPAPLPAADLCETLTRAMCEGNVGCCDRPERQYESVEACVYDNLRFCAPFESQAESDAFTYDALAAAELAAAITASAQSCGALPPLGLGREEARRDPPRGMAAILGPALEDGAACGGLGALGAPAHACINACVPDAGAEPMMSGLGGGLGGLGGLAGMSAGTCGPASPPLAEGAPCRTGLAGGGATGDAGSCAEGLRCIACALRPDGCAPDAGIAAGRCAPTGALGEACSHGSCADALYCDIDYRARPIAGTCAERLPDGAACTGRLMCESGHCEGVDLAPRGEGTCAPEPPERTHCGVWRWRIG